MANQSRAFAALLFLEQLVRSGNTITLKPGYQSEEEGAGWEYDKINIEVSPEKGAPILHYWPLHYDEPAFSHLEPPDEVIEALERFQGFMLSGRE